MITPHLIDPERFRIIRDAINNTIKPPKPIYEHHAAMEYQRLADEKSEAAK